MEKEIMKCVLRTVSPIHIGCDEVYEPTGFTVDENEGELTIFDPFEFVSGLEPDERKRFSKICKKGTIESIVEVYRFLREKQVRGRSVEICSEFTDHYAKVLSLQKANIQNELNRFTISRTAFRADDGRPYIPGSAVKGALRTAFLNMLDRKGPDLTSILREFRRKGGRKDDRHKKLEQKLLKLDRLPPTELMSKDPFRLVKVSDFMPAGEVKGKISYVINKKKKPSSKDARGPYQILETIQPGAVFTGMITVDAPQDENAVSMIMTLETLIESTSRFFENEKRREDRSLENIGVPLPAGFGNGNIALVRVGRHSGAESVTIERYRDIKIMLGGGKSRSLKYATTLWLTSESRTPNDNRMLAPLGWVELSRMTKELTGEVADREKRFQEKSLRKRSIEKREEAERLQELQAEQRRKEEEQQRLKEEKEAEQALKRKLESMTPEERSIYELKQPDIIENRVVEIYNTLDTVSGDNKIALAEALKDYWQRNGKWTKKECSKKQWEKVKKVKAVLSK